MLRSVGTSLFAFALSLSIAQQGVGTLPEQVRVQLIGEGYRAEDLQDLLLKDSYSSEGPVIVHTYLRQRWQGIEVWNGDIAIHTRADGSIVTVNNGSWSRMSERANSTAPAISPEVALAAVLAVDLPGAGMPALLSSEPGSHKFIYDGSAFSGEAATVQLFLVAVDDALRLAWNVNHYTPDGSHWWNVRIDAMTGEEIERNDWVSDCGFDHFHPWETRECPEEEPPMPASPNDFNVYGWPVESPSHGSRSLLNAPWTAGGIASPYGWQDTNGATGAEYTTTRGNNAWAKEDIANDNETTAGFSPNGGANLDFDFAINLAGAPSSYQSALITNLYYWNNLMHDVWYGFGFDDPAGNFQQNNYGRGGTGNDYVLADALDGSGTNNANFATPAEGSRPRMQMYVWNYTTPNRTSDLDNGVIAHEYGHGISNRLVGGPANVNCLTNAEQMGEGWSDFFALVMTMEPGDTGPTPRGIGTYVVGQATTGGGIRPAPYSTDFAVNNYTYAATNNAALTQPHGIGFVWCTMLWEMTWELIGVYGWDPNIYTGTGGNNRAMRLVIEGMKLTPCNPGFVGARDAILLADQNIYGGANQNALWAAFARRGLGVSASQGLATSRSDQAEAYNTPMTTNVGVSSIAEPLAGQIYNCLAAPTTVRALLRNYGSVTQSNFPVRYRLDGGAWTTQNYTGSLAAGASVTFSFSTTVIISGLGAHTVEVATNLAGDLYAPDNSKTNTITVVTGTTVLAPYTEGLSTASPTPTGWTIQNPDASYTWSTSLPAIGPGPSCASSRAWSIDNYNYNGVGQEDRLLTPLVNLGGLSLCRLKFDDAYARYNASLYDAFRVDISGNCGANWVTLLNQTSSVLATAPDNTALYMPASCAQWRANDLDISAYNGQTVLVRFVGTNGFGNTLLMDNVQFTGTASNLPVELLRFTATDRPDGVQIDWTTASEVNTDRFEVERSVSGTVWDVIGIRMAQGSSFTSTQYDLLDALPLSGLSYYRLHMIDLDGSDAYSDVASVLRKANDRLCYPNPNDGRFRVLVPTPSAAIELIDAMGRNVPIALVPTADGSQEIQVLAPAAGLYVLRITNGETLLQERIVVSGR